MCNIPVRPRHLGHVTGGIKVSLAVLGDFWSGQRSVMGLAAGIVPLTLSYVSELIQQPCYRYLTFMPLRTAQGDEEQLSVRTWPGCPEAAQKLLEMLSPTPINLSVSSKISKSCCVLVVFEQLRSTNFQEHLSPSPLTGDFGLSFRQ